MSKRLLSGRYEFRVEFFHVDSMFVVWHGKYVEYMEAARCRFLEAVDFSYSRMRSNGFAMPIVKLDLRYLKPLVFEQRFWVEVGLMGYESLLELEYVFKDEVGAKLALGHSAQAAVLLEDGRTCYGLPNSLKEGIEAVLANPSSYGF